MSFNIGQALLGGVESLVMSGGNPIAAVAGAVGGGCEGGSSTSSATSGLSGLDPSTLESALSQQSSAFTNIHTLSSLAQSAPQSDNLLASLIDGDDSGS
jgi:hypothetical protein